MNIGSYRLESLLGRGGFGEVWKAWDGKLGRWVALKRLTMDDPEDRRRFQREAQTAASLDHPGIAAIYEVGEGWIAMQWIDGATLKPGPDAVRRVRDAAVAVGFAHGKGIVHRDLKPANIMVERDGRVFVMDFGLARSVRADSSLTVSGALVGTPAYMSPEQAGGGRATPASDVWSLGVTLHELLSGRVPFSADSLVGMLMSVMTEEPPTLCGVPPDLATIVAKCLDKDPHRRYRDAAALAGDLTRFLEGAPISARPPGVWRRLRRHRAIAAGLLIVAVGSSAAALLIVPRLRRTEERIARHAEMQRLEAAIRTARPFFYIQDIDIRRKLDEVEAAIRDLERVEPKEADVLLALGEAWLFAGDSARAEGALMSAEALSPGDPRVHHALGRVWLDRAIETGLTQTRERGARARRFKQRSDRACRHLERAGDVPGSGLERQLLAVYRALAARDSPEALRRIDEGLARFGDEPGTEEFHLLRGCLTEGAERLAGLDRALARRPHYELALLIRAIAHHGAGSDPAALEDVDRSLRLNPRRAEAYAVRAAIRSRLGDAAGTVADCGRAIELDPTLDPPFAIRALIRLDAGDLAGALADFDAALRLNPDEPQALLNRSLVREKMGDSGGAIEDLDSAIAAKPDYAQAYEHRAGLRFDRGDYRGAMEDFDELVRLTPTGHAYTRRATAKREKGDLPGALADYGEAVRIDPAYVPAWLNRCEARLAAGDVDGAIADASEGVRLEPGNASAWGNRGVARHLKKDYRGALADFEAAVRIAPQDAHIRHNRGLLLVEIDRPVDAVAEFDAELRIDPTRIHGVYMRGNARRNAGDVEGALADYDEVLRRDGGYADAHTNRAVIRLQRKDYRGALADFDDAVRLGAMDLPTVHLFRGQARQGLEDWRGAAEDYARGLALGGAGWRHRAAAEALLREARRRIR